MSPGFPPSAFRSSELLSTPIQTSMEQSDFTSYDSTPETTSPYELHNQRPCSTWPGMRESAGAPQLAHQLSNNEARIQTLPSNNPRLQQFLVSNVQSNEPDVPVSNFSEWGSSEAHSAAWTPAGQRNNTFGDSSLLLQQSGIPSFMQDIHEHSVQQPIVDIDPYTTYPTTVAIHNSQPISQPITLPQQQIRRQSPDGSPFVSMQNHRVQTPTHQQMFQQSPDRSPFSSSQYHHTQGNSYSRRGSDSSDLASNFDTIRLQRVSSQQSNGKGVFKTPSIPSLNLAARRKKQRPAALGAVAMRSQSCTGPQNASPIPKCMTLSPSHSVRRIRSTGNSLNVMSGRIQKSGAGQRSPLNFQTFHEAGAFDSVDALTAQSTDTSQASAGVNTGPLTPHTPSKLENQSQSWDNHPTHFESNPAILQSQNFSHNTYDGSTQATSPPGTPFTEMQLYPQYQSQYAAPPLSAPPQLTSFPNISPPFNPTPVTPSNIFIPQQSLPEAYNFYPMPQMQQQQQQQQAFPVLHYSQSQPSFYACHPPQIVHSSSSMSGLHNFYNNPPQHKEMEFVIQTFDTPKEAQPPPPKQPHQQREYVFQNSGPKDF